MGKIDDQAKNLEAISKAIVQHNGNCEGQIVEIQMNPHEVERLGWDEFQGIPIMGSDQVGTGAFRLICDREQLDTGGVESEKQTERELAVVGAPETELPVWPGDDLVAERV